MFQNSCGHNLVLLLSGLVKQNLIPVPKSPHIIITQIIGLFTCYIKYYDVLLILPIISLVLVKNLLSCNAINSHRNFIASYYWTIFN